MEQSNQQTVGSASSDLLSMSAKIAVAFVSNTNSSLDADGVNSLLRSTFGTLSDLAGGNTQVAAEAPARQEPFTSIKKSVQRDHIVCLFDGKKLKTLKRYLARVYDMTPEQYRQHWNLPSDYPMVAPEYSEQRRDMAKKIGLGRGGGRRKVADKATTAAAPKKAVGRPRGSRNKAAAAAAA